ncbi:MAG TPA: ATP-binding protein [Candidatus Limnocylindria bacterium]|nr:ATP-binding protein [Candidatus Limnocylindria bacterium]
MNGRRPSLEEALAENERLHRELEASRTHVTALEDELRSAHRLEAVGRVAGGIAHDFSNVIAVIAGYADLLLRRADVTEPIRAHAESIKKATTWGQHLTQHVIASGRRLPPAARAVDLNATATSVARTLTPLFGDHIHVALRLDPGLPAVAVNPGQLEQVVINLLINARDALAGGGRVTVETSVVEPGDGSRPAPPSLVRLRVTDTGCGMDAATRSRVFEPYFTTKDAGKGTGLGLSTVFGIVTQHGGQIEVTSEAGEGATFTVHLPAADNGSPAATNATAAGTVLLVEDEPGVRDLVVEILELAGYQVLQARDAANAMSASRRHEGALRLLVADLSAPGVRGERLAQELVKTRPGLKVLYLSGDLEDPVEEAPAVGADRAVIHKPFTIDALMHTLTELLATR